MKTYLVTGGAGFIGSNFVLAQRRLNIARIVNLDLLTYAGNPENLVALADDPDYVFVQGDICDRALVQETIGRYRPDSVIHFAAESHVDRSIVEPDAFVRTNVVGTFTLLDEARRYWLDLPDGERGRFRFHHVSTDEVYGSLAPDDPAFTEQTPYRPNSPYSASKASSDHLVRSYHHTYGLPALITNCSNNYGPYQFPEKLIPLVIVNAFERKPLPVYGDGGNVRDWLYVEDHVEALQLVLERGTPGETYNIGGSCEKANIDVVGTICDLVDEIDPGKEPRRSLITFVKDRPGHDRRYAIDSTKIRNELGWAPRESFATGIGKTIRWYLDNSRWIDSVRTGAYRQWIETNYGER